ncbi:MAG: hypothetical protein K0S76_451 [Herbinix sp.]|jgi:hypothetical protein|nr:hypothetical protein [Herbinix sp.]
MKYKVEFARFCTMEVEAETVHDAEDIASVMEDEEIERKAKADNGYEIWQVTKVI